MIAVFPAGGTLAAVIVTWLGATASVGRHARPGRWARIRAWLFPAVSPGRHQWRG